ncbi:AAR2 family protein [Rhynchospora pubera]|uniref:AAR2 family protein n=1 Tax=Rhynchospora pubera TaxID=906938 RepID=A0AAV8FEE1_9POAL|nr:AAR2 family protein [Rhynchospora pubera]
MEMDSDTALDLVKKGASLLLLDVPQFTLLGIDTQVFSVGPKFKGMKMIPPGCHFIYYSSSNKEGNEFSPIVGFFLTLHPSQVVVRRWHQQDEKLIKLSEDEDFRYSEAVERLEFDSQLGPYQLDRYTEWQQLSNFLSQDIIERLEPIGGEITIMAEAELIENKGPQTEMEKRLMDQLKGAKCASIEVSKKRESKGCYYTKIPHFVRNQHIPGDELTALNLDKTKLLDTILNRDFGSKEDLLLGELQFSFIAFMMGQSLEAFYQWKSIVSLLLSCTEAPLHTRTHLFLKFVKVLYYQIKHGFHKSRNQSSGGAIGNSLFLDEGWFSKDIFLYRLCKDFFPLVLEAQAVDGDLLLWTRKLKKLLESSLGWDFDNNALIAEEDDEFAPVVVPLEETNF